MPEPEHDAAPFVPKGALAFFLVMIVVYVATWFAMYALLVGRG
jgi:hypothetical protein